MTGIDYSFASPEDNLLYDEALLHFADKAEGDEALRVWESPQYFIVLGRTCKEEDDLEREVIFQENMPVYRRASGGGTVIQGQGCYNFSLILSKEKRPEIDGITSSYQYISARLAEAMGLCGIKVVFQPISDLAVAENNKKFSGNAQKRGRQYILHHGTILYDFDLDLIARYLKMPKQVPDYRDGRGHLDFVTNVPVKPTQVKEALAKVFQIDVWRDHVSDEESGVMELLRAKRSWGVVL